MIFLNACIPRTFHLDISKVPWPQETEGGYYLLHLTIFASYIECFILKKSIAIHKFPKSDTLDSSQTALILTPTDHQILLIYFSGIALVFILLLLSYYCDIDNSFEGEKSCRLFVNSATNVGNLDFATLV